MTETFSATFFCYLDILGFSRFVLNLSKQPQFQRDPYKKQKMLLNYYNILEPLVMGSVFGKKTLKHEDKVATLRTTGTPQINSYIVSDSIFLWTDDVTYESFQALILIIKHLINANFTWTDGFPIRGGVAMGSISYRQSNFGLPKINEITALVGDALVKAALLEVNQNWAGCMVDSEIITFLQNQNPKIPIEKELMAKQLVISYPIPVKQESSSNSYKYAVIWPTAFKPEVPNIYDEPLQLTFERNGPINHPSIQEKLNNTRLFVHHLFRIYNSP